MPRKPNPLGTVRTQVMLPVPVKEWLDSKASERDKASKAIRGRAVKMSHLVTNAVEFMRANPEVVEAWARNREVADPLKQREVREALSFFHGNRKLANAFLRARRSEHGGRTRS